VIIHHAVPGLPSVQELLKMVGLHPERPEPPPALVYAHFTPEVEKLVEDCREAARWAVTQGCSYNTALFLLITSYQVTSTKDLLHAFGIRGVGRLARRARTLGLWSGSTSKTVVNRSWKTAWQDKETGVLAFLLDVEAMDGKLERFEQDGQIFYGLAGEANG
jgi:hypothetical protein